MVALLQFVFMFALALTVSAQGTTNNLAVPLGTAMVPVAEYLNFPFTGAISPCNDQCTKAKAAFDSSLTNVAGLCSNQTAELFHGCQQCMFTSLIAANKPMPNPKAGSTPLLSGYVANCAQANQTIPKNFAALVLPPTWDGPTGIFVPTAGLVFTVGAGTFLSIASILILSNM